MGSKSSRYFPGDVTLGINLEKCMQSLAAYSFSASVDSPIDRIIALERSIDDWLRRKGADAPESANGSFYSKTGDGTGQFSRQLVQSSQGSIYETELIETTHNGAMFTTHIQIAFSGQDVHVHATLSATPGESRIAPIGLYPRCPHVLRAMIEQFPDWKYAGQDIPLARAFDATSPDDALDLCRALLSGERRFPVVVVSNDEDEVVWPNIYKKLAEQLVGLAYVAYVSAESSWVLTDELGPRNSCYLGAVRLYWPVRRADGSIVSENWLPSRMETLGADDSGRNRFLATFRRVVMSTAALTISPPSVLRSLRQTAEKERLMALEEGARDKELDSIIEENHRLTSELEAARETIRSLKWKSSEGSYFQQTDAAANDSDSNELVEEASLVPPAPGDTFFYKKIGSGGGVDSLVRTKSCNHKESNWRPAFKGVQAEKGLLKLEKRNDWKSIAHCSACTGGGRWRVNW